MRVQIPLLPTQVLRLDSSSLESIPDYEALSFCQSFVWSLLLDLGALFGLDTCAYYHVLGFETNGCRGRQQLGVAAREQGCGRASNLRALSPALCRR